MRRAASPCSAADDELTIRNVTMFHNRVRSGPCTLHVRPRDARTNGQARRATCVISTVTGFWALGPVYKH